MLYAASYFMNRKKDICEFPLRILQVPLRWLSIEAMKDNLYSSKSDVWAFAIVLWEIGTLGELQHLFNIHSLLLL